ncbi:MAG: DNA polymerase III subunit gamma/tau [Candidatus Berkelbacteria bacterium]|nr:MAG: DNA polymerase III subunit gamma/tau [Candidatus Berkelbacteria bacterium]QQG51576.1 MAG: DNA polymerase III subunit gamma/tau [Candidatus Berkelbacteria bacterium]
MSSLYRAYRPKIFDDVLGQEHICSSLVTSLKNNRVGHAYLFSGSRGTGKTTLARLFARSLNCQKRPPNQNPCNSCELCLEIGEGRSVDVFEIDAASNRGIDEIRELRERVNFAPARAKYKVYIIDEVHMLTKEAFNALLKTLEEPPSHVIFILATTELHKVPETIISRCQRYQFRRASTEALVSLLETVGRKEKLKLDGEAVQAIAARADGSYRDALTLLGNIASQEGELNVAKVRELLGLPPHQIVLETLQLLQEGDADKLASVLKNFLASGGDITVLAKAVADECKNMILDNASLSVEPAVARVLEQLLLVLARSRSSVDPTALILAEFINLALTLRPAANLKVTNAPPAMRDVQKVEKPLTVDAPAPVDTVAASVQATGTTDADATFWNKFLEGIKGHNHALYMVVRAARLEGLSETSVVVAVKFRFYVDRMNEARNRKIIEAVANEVAGRPMKLECVIRADLDVGVSNNDDLVRTVVDVFELEETK